MGALDTDQDQAANSEDFVSGHRINVKSSVDEGTPNRAGSV